MSKHQIESCARRLEAVSGYEAAQFRVSMREAGKLITKGFAMKRRAWEQYRAALGIQKPEAAE